MQELCKILKVKMQCVCVHKCALQFVSLDFIGRCSSVKQVKPGNEKSYERIWYRIHYRHKIIGTLLEDIIEVD